MVEFQPGTIRSMSQSDLEIVLKWRNHESIRRFMYTQHEIQMDEHSLWFKRVSVDPKQHLLIYQMDFKPLGFIRIQEISAGGIASWGFYAAPETPPGTGSALGYAALEYAFQKLKLHKLCGQAIAFNKRSIRFHMKIGFTKEGILKQQYFDGQNHHDVWCFGLIATKWRINHQGGSSWK